MKTLAVLTAGIIAAGSANAADDTAVAMGFGVQTCAQFAQDYQRETYVENSYFNWAQGYMSGLNTAFALAHASTRDLNAVRTDDEKARIRGYCSDHPLDEVEVAVADLYFSLPLVAPVTPNKK
jgi:hypothetical protein